MSNTVNWQAELHEADDELIRAALEPAHIPALMAALVHLRGTTEHLRGDIKPIVLPFAEVEHGLDDVQCAAARKLAFDSLCQYRDAACPELADPGEDAIAETMDYVTGEPVSPQQMDLLREELNLFGEDRRRVPIDTGNLPLDFRVLVIGAGMSGILAAIRLQEAGIPFLVVDKNTEVGGTWHENSYPGCKVDSPNHLYNYIFEPNHQWPGHFSGRAELYRYFKGVVDKYALRDHIQLNTVVIEATYHDSSSNWQVQLEGPEGTPVTEIFSAVISAAGQLNTPKMPDIEGMESFEGAAFHSARWQHQHDLRGKRVAVIGTGCSATQIVPAIAELPASLKVFQRSAGWLNPAPDYHTPMSEAELWCFRNIPFYARWYRFFLYRARALDGLLPYLCADDNWDGGEEAIGGDNAQLREVLIEYVRAQVGDDNELFSKLIPDYPVGGKRPVIDDGSWITALKRDNVQLLTERIERIVPQGIQTSDGQLHEVDVLIYGTGFKADEFLSPMHITGRNGIELQQQWHGNARAYMGITVPNFPNFYCLYGPNTNIVVGSSIIFFSECAMRYVMGCIKLQVEGQCHSLECKQEVHDRYNEKIDALNRRRAWGSPNVSSWYKNKSGRVSQNWPGTHLEFWQMTLAPNPEDFLLS